MIPIFIQSTLENILYFSLPRQDIRSDGSGKRVANVSKWAKGVEDDKNGEDGGKEEVILPKFVSERWQKLKEPNVLHSQGRRGLEILH